MEKFLTRKANGSLQANDVSLTPLVIYFDFFLNHKFIWLEKIFGETNFFFVGIPI